MENAVATVAQEVLVTDAVAQAIATQRAKLEEQMKADMLKMQQRYEARINGLTGKKTVTEGWVNGEAYGMPGSKGPSQWTSPAGTTFKLGETQATYIVKGVPVIGTANWFSPTIVFFTDAGTNRRRFHKTDVDAMVTVINAEPVEETEAPVIEEAIAEEIIDTPVIEEVAEATELDAIEASMQPADKKSKAKSRR